MNASVTAMIALLLLVPGLFPAPAPVARPAPAQEFATPTTFLAEATPTFVVGTAGDDRCDRAIRGQAAMIRSLLFADAALLRDDEVDDWPATPIVYGGPHVNSLIARLAPHLPFELERGRLLIGGRTFEGDDVRLIVVVPARPAAEGFAGHPEFLLYAGTGVPGVAEINGIPHGGAPIQVCDTFGELVAANWTRAADGSLGVQFGRTRPRIAWRAVEPSSADLPGAAPRVLFPEPLAEEALAEARAALECWRHLATAARRLGLSSLPPSRIYVYPDLRSIQSLTGKAASGHADVEAGALHVVRGEGGVHGPLIQHEGAHLLAYRAYGAAASPLLGEGLAVWVAGEYGGYDLDQWVQGWKGPLPALAELQGAGFRELPERAAYPLGGNFVGAAVELVGVDAFCKELLGAGPSEWEAACARAGTTPAAIEKAWVERYRDRDRR
jgi:hypothetical protein